MMSPGFFVPLTHEILIPTMSGQNDKVASVMLNVPLSAAEGHLSIQILPATT
jgi:hypothetical protein